MPTQIIYFKDSIYFKLKDEKNMSSLVNDLLGEYYKEQEEPKKRANEERILAEVAQNMNDSAQVAKIEKFLKTMDIKKYKKGVKEGKWRGTIEYAKSELGLK